MWLFSQRYLSTDSLLTLTYWFSWMFLPLTRSWHADVSYSMSSTERVRVVLTLLLVLEPVDDSSFTFLSYGGNITR